MARNPTEPEYRSGAKGKSYFVQDKKLYVCPAGRFNVESTGAAQGGSSGPVMVLHKGGVYIFFSNPEMLSLAMNLCKHPTPHGPEPDYTVSMPTGDGLGFLLNIIPQWKNHALNAINYEANAVPL